MVFNTDLDLSYRDDEAAVSDVFQLLLQAEMLLFMRLTLQVAARPQGWVWAQGVSGAQGLREQVGAECEEEEVVHVC